MRNIMFQVTSKVKKLFSQDVHKKERKKKKKTFVVNLLWRENHLQIEIFFNQLNPQGLWMIKMCFQCCVGENKKWWRKERTDFFRRGWEEIRRSKNGRRKRGASHRLHICLYSSFIWWMILNQLVCSSHLSFFISTFFKWHELLTFLSSLVKRRRSEAKKRGRNEFFPSETLFRLNHIFRCSKSANCTSFCLSAG